jgi:hypothetical protein
LFKIEYTERDFIGRSDDWELLNKKYLHNDERYFYIRSNDFLTAHLTHVHVVGQLSASYWKSFIALILITIVLVALVNVAGYLFFNDSHFLLVLATISTGSLFMVLIIFDSSVLPLFGKTHVSTLAVSCVVIFELLSIPFVAYDTWFWAFGFL